MKPSEELTKGIVQIIKYDGTGTGTGFIISNNLIATCAHVIKSAHKGPGDRVKVRFYLDENVRDAIVIPERWRSPDKEDIAEDIAILQLEDELPSEFGYLQIGSSARVEGHKVKTFGFPFKEFSRGLRGKGEIYGITKGKGEKPLLQIDSKEITAGFSGAPLWDESKSRVIGIVAGTFEKELGGQFQTVAFAIPSETLLSICPELREQDICPYKGLSPFNVEDDKLFFGRKKLVQELEERLIKNPQFLAVVGPSGSGKSSLVFAGLLPRIKRGEIVGFENARIVTFRPNNVSVVTSRPNDVSKSDSVYYSDPYESLRLALEKSEIYIEKVDLWKGICSYLEKNPEIRLVIYADQFDTLFLNVDKAKQVEFLQGIQGLLKSTSKASFLLTVRGASYDSLLLDPMFEEYLSEGQVNVTKMSEEEMKEAIQKPAEITGLGIETGLEDKIIDDLKKTKTPLPLLEFTLSKLWELRSNGMLTYKCYKEIGRATGAIGKWADETYNKLSTEEQELARKIFTRLIHCRKGEPDSSRRTQLKSLAEGYDEQAVRRLIEKLDEAHILATDREVSKETETVEIIHDSLLTEWKQLRAWIDEQRSFLIWRGRLEEIMNEWNIREDEGSLLRGYPLAQAKDWLEKYEQELNLSEIKYIKASSALEEKERAEKERAEKERIEKDRVEKERAEKERIRSRNIKGLAIASILLLILAGLAIAGWYQADQQKHNAEEKTTEANVSKFNFQSKVHSLDPSTLDQSILVAIKSFQINRTLDADKLIRQGLLLIPHNFEALNHNGSVNNVVFSPDGKYIATASDDNTTRLWDAATGKNITLNHNAPVKNVVFSPDGKYIATASADNTSGIWDAATGKQIFVLNHTNRVNNVVFSPDGKYIATASWDNTSRLWDAATGKQKFVLNHNGSVNDVNFSSDGKYIATASDDKTARVWDAATGKQIKVLNHNGVVNNVVFSPDGKYIVTASTDNNASLWNAVTGKQIFVLNHNAPVNNVVFSPDGKYIATASSDKTARLWDAATGKQIKVFEHDNRVNNVVFSPDGKYVATASNDKTARLWDLFTGNAFKGKENSFLDHTGEVNNVVFSPDGRYVATASTDKTARLWDAFTGEENSILNHNAPVNNVAFSPDGKYVATASQDNTSCLWDAATGEPISAPLIHNGSVNNVVFSPDGKYVATASDDNTSRLWYAYTCSKKVLKHDGPVRNVVFSPDGKYVATASDDKTAHVWDTATGTQIFVLNHSGPVTDVNFSSDGKYVATASADATARVWDVATGKEIFAPLKHDGPVLNIVFSPDGKYVATASADATARVWDAATGKQIFAPLKHDGVVNNVIFSPDGKYIATASADKTARLWDAATGKQIKVLEHDGVVNNVVFSPDGKYIATASNDKTARLWDAITARLLDAFKGNAFKDEEKSVLNHDEWVKSIVFSPDGKYVATASGDSTARLWICNTDDLIEHKKTEYPLRQYPDLDSLEHTRLKQEINSIKPSSVSRLREEIFEFWDQLIK